MSQTIVEIINSQENTEYELMSEEKGEASKNNQCCDKGQNWNKPNSVEGQNWNKGQNSELRTQNSELRTQNSVSEFRV